jgi:hypothetical protein
MGELNANISKYYSMDHNPDERESSIALMSSFRIIVFHELWKALWMNSISRSPNMCLCT